MTPERRAAPAATGADNHNNTCSPENYHVRPAAFRLLQRALKAAELMLGQRDDEELRLVLLELRAETDRALHEDVVA